LLRNWFLYTDVEPARLFAAFFSNGTFGAFRCHPALSEVDINEARESPFGAPTIKERKNTMKSRFTFLATLCLGSLLAWGCQSTGARQAVDTSAVSVTFVHPENFTDLKDSLAGSERGRERYADLLGSALREAAATRIPAGTTLEIRITDVDLAGDYLPSARTGYDIRVIKPLYAPKADLAFTLKDASGKVLKEGERHLINLNFMNEIGLNRSDELYYDIKLLRDWVSSEFSR
jgi:hypothetical protein